MKTLNLALLFMASVMLFSCKEKNDKPIDTAPDSNSSLIEQDNDTVVDDNTSSSSTATYSDNVDGTVDDVNSGTGSASMGNAASTTMYSDLDMTKEQIAKYETASKKYMETVRNNKNLSQKAMREQRNKNLKAVLSTSQYTKYEELEENYYPAADSTAVKQQ